MHLLLATSALIALLGGCQAPGDSAVETSGSTLPQLTAELADRFAGLAVEGIVREYPNKPGNVIFDAAGVRGPREMHPAFYGSFDWHSSVHGHWMLIRLLRVGPQTSQRNQAVHAALDTHLTRANIEAEVAYFEEPGQKSFERMYGWAWALRLAAELHAWNKEVPDHEAVHRWREAIRPLEDYLVAKIPPYLERLQWPIRIGEHRDTGFALGQILDYANVVGNQTLSAVVTQRARDYYLADRNYPAHMEPSGEDFFSSCLNEADLMRRVLPAPEYSVWLDSFLPGLAKAEVPRLLEPVGVTDVTDGKLVHLAGLNLHRAWCWLGVASALPQGDARIPVCKAAAAAHYESGLGYVFSGDYAGEHWLASFAVYLVTGSGRD
ncbi:MAG: DUF2891 domain-containing protein [Planctomycetes bacterium]|nr:DUF2891 domain-containing protein [Planctomycetota bacterium]